MEASERVPWQAVITDDELNGLVTRMVSAAAIVAAEAGSDDTSDSTAD
jgi:hypothetical protein